MNKELKLNFYDEIIAIHMPKKYEQFKAEIARLYAVDPSDVEELIVYYFDTVKVKHFIRNEGDFIEFQTSNKQIQMTVYLEIHEESRLFKKDKAVSTFSDSEKLKKEILEKEALLKEVIEKERREQQRKKEEAKKKSEEDRKKAKLEELRQKKLLLEKEEEFRKKKEKEELELEVSKIIQMNIDKLKETLVKNAVSESLNAVDKQMEKRVQESMCKDLHIGYECSSCNMSPIIGARYTCPVTNDFHLCESCESLLGEGYQYPLLKYRNNKQIEIKLKLATESKKIVKEEKEIKKDNLISYEDLIKKK